MGVAIGDRATLARLSDESLTAHTASPLVPPAIATLPVMTRDWVGLNFPPVYPTMLSTVTIGTVAPWVVTVTWVMAERVPENTVTVMTLTTLGTLAVVSVVDDDVGAGVGAVRTHALVAAVNEGALRPQEVTTGAVWTQSHE